MPSPCTHLFTPPHLTPMPSPRTCALQRIGPSAERSITFDAIATASNLPVDQVELLVMRALSLKLIRGLLDQVSPRRLTCACACCALCVPCLVSSRCARTPPYTASRRHPNGCVCVRACMAAQVDGTLRVTWVQPRVLQTQQVSLMKDRLQTWSSTVNKTLAFLENETPEFSGV